MTVCDGYSIVTSLFAEINQTFKKKEDTYTTTVA